MVNDNPSMAHILSSVDRISFMLSVAGTARADVTMTPQRTYYRFMTEDSLEDGELTGLQGVFESEVTQALAVFKAGVGVSASTEPVKFTLFVNNQKVIPEILNNHTLGEFIDRMKGLYTEFAFLAGFK